MLIVSVALIELKSYPAASVSVKVYVCGGCVCVWVWLCVCFGKWRLLILGCLIRKWNAATERQNLSAGWNPDVPNQRRKNFC